MQIPRDPNKLEFARYLRRTLTPQERKLWYGFLRYYPVKFYKQRIIGPYIADFFCHAARLVIELDGWQHRTPDGLAYDARRTAFFEQFDIRVLRFKNKLIDDNYDGVCEFIGTNVKARIASFQ